MQSPNSPTRLSRAAAAARLLAFSACLAICAPLSAAPPAPAADDWTALVPGDVRFYVEINDLRSIRERFRQLGVWQTVRDLAEGRAGPTPADRPSLSESLLSLSADEAVSDVLGRRAALMASSSAAWQRGVILTEMGSAEAAARLLDRIAAEETSAGGGIRRFTARGGILVAQRGPLLILGPANDPEGLWERAASLAAGKLAPSLKARSEFASLYNRIADRRDGFVFASWAGDDPFAFAGCHRMIAAFEFDEDGLRAQIHGQLREPAAPSAPVNADFLGELPADTLAAWCGSLDASVMTPGEDRAPGRRLSLLGQFLSIFAATAGGESAPFEGLGPAAAIVVGMPARARPGEFNLPPVTLACQSGDPAALVARMDIAMGFLGRYLRSLAAREGERPPVPGITERRTGDLEVHILPLGRLLAQRLDLDFISDIDVCWAAWDGRFVVSSDAYHIERLHRAAAGRLKTLEQDAVMTALVPAADERRPLVEWAMLRGRHASSCLGRALQYIGHQKPDALRDQWWRDWAARRLERRSRFGVALRDAPDLPGAAEVVDVEFDSPAAGKLRPGDRIVAFDDRPLDAKAPALDAARRYAERGTRTSITLLVARGETEHEITVQVLPETLLDPGELAPIRAMRQLRLLLQRVEAVTIERRAAAPDWLDLDLRVQWYRPGR